ncbi:MAG: hypothetical protein JST20_13155 [Bacteroidetes bacterium]|nr:hypothetical protein [Bacteroidota bacterium]
MLYSVIILALTLNTQSQKKCLTINTVLDWTLNVLGDAELVIVPLSQTPILKRVALIKGFPTQITINAQELGTGVYTYSIIIQGKILASKKMIVIH